MQEPENKVPPSNAEQLETPDVELAAFLLWLENSGQ
jgi:hypothetical protein